MMSIKTSLETEIKSELEALRDMEAGTETYKSTVDGLTKLADRLIEIDKLELDKRARNEEREFDQYFKQTQLDEERKDRKIKNILNGAGILMPVGVTVWGVLVSLNFEKTGSVTTVVGRGLINKLLPKK